MRHGSLVDLDASVLYQCGVLRSRDRNASARIVNAADESVGRDACKLLYSSATATPDIQNLEILFY